VSTFDEFEEVVEECNSCTRIIIQPALIPDVPEKRICQSYIAPASKWSNGKRCPLAPKLTTTTEFQNAGSKKYVDPIKASKRMMGKKK
jgi:hypothetical protein